MSGSLHILLSDEMQCLVRFGWKVALLYFINKSRSIALSGICGNQY
ncbi:hypothetical protein PROVRETT_08866 [Providencia rettgeri DSM 1131]|nr:hypothetical protein PROVRETT_08866 [Providencia rettgeri DSM 1131]